MIQTLSSEPGFGLQLSLPVKVQLPAKWNLLGTTVDFMVTVGYFRTAMEYYILILGPPVDLYSSYYFTNVVQYPLSGFGYLIGKRRTTDQASKSRGSNEVITATLNFRQPDLLALRRKPSQTCFLHTRVDQCDLISPSSGESQCRLCHPEEPCLVREVGNIHFGERLARDPGDAGSEARSGSAGC